MGLGQSKVADEEDDNREILERDTRRRNSLAFYIAQYVQNEDPTNFEKLVSVVRAANTPKKAIDPKLKNSSRIAFNEYWGLLGCHN